MCAIAVKGWCGKCKIFHQISITLSLRLARPVGVASLLFWGNGNVGRALHDSYVRHSRAASERTSGSLVGEVAGAVGGAVAGGIGSVLSRVSTAFALGTMASQTTAVGAAAGCKAAPAD